MIIPLGEWLPDVQHIGNPGLTIARNMRPVVKGYTLFPGLLTVSANAISTSALLGGFSAQSGSTVEDFTGDTTKLYRLTWNGTDITDADATRLAGGAYAVPSGNYWDFCQYGEQILACNGGSTSADVMQTLTIGDANFVDMTAGQPKAKTITTVSEFVVVGHTWDSTDGEVKNRVRWASYSDATSANAWDVNPATQADFQDLSTADGAVQRICGGDDAFIVTTNAVYIQSYEGPPTIFRFENLNTGFGTQHPHSVVRDGNYVYLWAPAGPVRVGIDGSIKWIARGKCERYFQDKVQRTSAANIISFKDSNNGAIGFSYGINQIASNEPMFYYFPDFDQWVEVEPGGDPEEYIWSSKIVEAPNGERIESAIWKQANALVGASENQLRGYFDGTKYNSYTFQTGAVSFFNGQRALIKEGRILGSLYGTGEIAGAFLVKTFDDPNLVDWDNLSSVAWTHNAVSTRTHTGLVEGLYFVFGSAKPGETVASSARFLESIEITDASPTGRY